MEGCDDFSVDEECEMDDDRGDELLTADVARVKIGRWVDDENVGVEQGIVDGCPEADTPPGHDIRLSIRVRSFVSFSGRFEEDGPR